MQRLRNGQSRRLVSPLTKQFSCVWQGTSSGDSAPLGPLAAYCRRTSLEFYKILLILQHLIGQWVHSRSCASVFQLDWGRWV